MRPPRSGVAAFRLVYGLVLFVVSLSTLEQFDQLNEDTLNLPPRQFHMLIAGIALAVACFEGFSMKGLAGIRDYFEVPDHMVEVPPNGIMEFRGATFAEVGEIYHLARRRYGSGYKFPERVLRKWWQVNRACFFVMRCNGAVVAYIDAFPICERHYKGLLAGMDEQDIVPQCESTATDRSSFYIASFVMLPQFSGHILAFIGEAWRFYADVYKRKPWQRICAMAATDRGTAWVKQKEMAPVDGTDMWSVDRIHVANLTTENRTFWEQMLPP